MAIFVGGTPISLNGTTWVTIVAAPTAGKQREVLGLYCENLDTVMHTIKLRKNIGGVFYEVYPRNDIDTLLRAQLLPAPIILDGTTMSLEASMAAVVTTTNPRIDVSVFEVP